MNERDDNGLSEQFVGKEPCPACGSRDNLARYADGHAYCFGCEHREPPDEEYRTSSSAPRKRTHMADDLLPPGEYTNVRGISEEVCRQFGYTVGRMGEKKAHIAAYRNKSGDIAAQHVRLKGKEFPWIGDKNKLQLFGQHLMRDGASKIIITEGEIDAMSVAEILRGGKGRFYAMSVGKGAKGAKKDIAENLPELEKAQEIILMFDNAVEGHEDDPGPEAAVECARLFRPGKCKIATLPLKDANDMLRAGRGPELVDAIFSAKEWRPEGVTKLSDIRDTVLTDPVEGLPWWHEGLTKATLGRRYGELDALGAGTGVGKTDFLTQQIDHDIRVERQKVGIFFFEQQPRETGRRLAGKAAGRKFHLPSDPETNPWEQHELVDALDDLDTSGELFMFDHFGSADYDLVEETIRYLYHSEDVKLFYVDHLTALAAQEDDERKALETIMARLGGLVKELNIWVCLISHLATPEGKPHEEGGRVMIRHFKGSRAIGYWSHHMFGLERNQQAEDEEERSTTTFRVLKDRVTGLATGRTFKMGYDHDTGRLLERSFTGGGSSGFSAVDGADTIF